MSLAATSKSAARGKHALTLTAAVLIAGVAVLMGGVGGAGATSLDTASTTTAETVSTSSALAGTPVTFGATITASDGTAPTGLVQFVAQFTAAGSSSPSLISLGQVNVTAGTSSSTASLTTSALLAGTYQVTAQYNPNGSIAWNGSSSSQVSVAIQSASLATTTIGFTESVQTIAEGASVTFSSTLSTAPGDPTPTGIVTYAAGPDVDHMITLGQTSISNGTATLPVSGWSAGTYVLVARYGGDSVYAAATSGTLSLTVTPVSVAVTTHTTLTLTPSTILAGQSVTISAHIVKDGTPNPPPGGPIVSFAGGVLGSDPSTWVKVGDPGQTTLDANGNASETVGGWSPGTYTIVAQYTGDITDGSSSGSATLVVLPVGVGSATSLTYDGATSGVWHDSATLSGQLTDGSGNPVAGKPVTFAVGGDSCTGTTDANGEASCQVTLGTTPGTATVAATFYGDSTTTGSTASHAFTIAARPTTTSAASVTAAPGTTATLSGTLTDVETGSPVSGVALSLEVGPDTCTGTTNAGGTATCTVAASEGVGGHTITASFAGSGGYAASSGTGTLTIQTVPTTTAYTGDAQDLAGSTATLSATVAPAPDGGTVTFTLGSQSCSAPAAGGTASCTIALDQAAGGYTVTVAYGGDAGYLPSSTTAPFTIVSRTTTTGVSSIGPVLAGTTVTLTGNLSTNGSPLSGKPLTLSLGTQSCTATTDANGNASCSVTQSGPLGPATVSATFGGDSMDKPSSASSSTIVYALAPGGGTFVIGNLSTTGTVTFWGSQWWKLNALSGGPAPNTFKGYAMSLSSPACGATWTTNTGSSSPPPAGPLPAYLAVVVSSSTTQSGSQVSGTVASLVIVKTSRGYANDSGHVGTGTVVATVCGG